VASALAAAGGNVGVCWEGGDVQLTNEMRAEYERRFSTCAVNPNRKAEVEAVITLMMKGRGRYQTVAKAIGVPWYVIAAIHSLECDSRFDCHLHNGDPLTARTFEVPAGRPPHAPASGHLPYTWEESAIDALLYEGFEGWHDWSIAGALFKLEAYNGFGSRAHGIATPYLWGGSQFYKSGKYVADHVFNPTAVSKEIGAAVLLRRMLDQNLTVGPVSPPAPATATPAADQKCTGVQY
jgi:lysozyme family protein